jgi:hypothetical protein
VSGFRRALWGLIAAGLAVKLALAFALYGHVPDVNSFALVRDVLHGDRPWDLYSLVNNDTVGPRWPYPPALFPWILAAGKAANVTGLAFHGLIQIPAILADAATAWLVQAELGRRGASERARLWAAGAIALGPLYILISGWWGQVDALATLPAVAGLIVWTRRSGTRDVLAAGVLIGLAASIKTPLGLTLLALLPSARGWREAGTVAAVAVAVPLAMLAPFLVADPDGTVHAFRYAGLPAQGGLSLIVQPHAVNGWLGHTPLYRFHNVLEPVSGLINVAVFAAVLAVAVRRHAAAVPAAVFLWLAILAGGSGFTFSFVLWLVPFLLLAGHLRAALAVQVAMVPPALLLVTAPYDSPVPELYAAWMVAAWLASLVALVLAYRRLRPEPPPTTVAAWSSG